MIRKGMWTKTGMIVVVLSLLLSFTSINYVTAQDEMPEMLDPRLDVRPVVTGLDNPITMAFLGPDEFLVLEKNTGQVKHVMNGEVQGTVLDLAVNFASERGLLGIALSPDFPTDPGVYLYWSCIAPPPPEDDPFFPTQDACNDTPELGPDVADTDDILATPLLGNRVDRFSWDGSMLTYDHNLIMLRSFQNDGAPEPPNQGDEEQPPRANHNGGVLAFGQDGKLYIFIGDEGRRGQLQNLRCGPTDVYDCPGEDEMAPDDQFGGPQPDDAHLTGVILRLNPDGTAPEDNPFFEAGAEMGGEVGENIQKIFSYGHRNSFGLAVDPASGNVWLQENGDDTFSELNLVEPGLNGGWIQIEGPLERIEQYREIETTFFAPPSTAPNLQQLRWPPDNIAESAEEALSRLFMIPGAAFDDPEFSWKWEVAPGGIGFVNSRALGPQFENDLFMGAAIPALEGGYLFHFNLTGNRDMIAVDDPRLEDRVADNEGKHEITESESLLIGRNFGSGTDIETGPNGNVYVVSLTHGAVYEIFRVQGGGGGGGGDGDQAEFEARLTGNQEVPPVDTKMRGDVEIEVENNRLDVELSVRNNTHEIFAAHIHCAPPGEAGPIGVTLFMGSFTKKSGMLVDANITAPDADNQCGWTSIDDVVAAMESGNAYVNVHTTAESGGVPSGEIRGDLLPDEAND
ncbi:MAG TPA: PQQ-dependent sugar dehydrogenase [Anaerolineales bacterium]|jgi:glucose/arabinose dehydrogenase|nr:PQQ-dependent sugar dehydrogenase [Anaerolineales bacterium]